MGSRDCWKSWRVGTDAREMEAEVMKVDTKDLSLQYKTWWSSKASLEVATTLRMSWEATWQS